jgi:eukaryotic-like serine/threonine-protein kinase
MGESIGRYEILRRLGSGGMAEVYLAQLTGGEGFQKRVAIKRVHEDLSLNPEHLRSFADEARLVAQLSHPNIVQVFEFDHDGDAPFLVMEYVDGLPLSKAMRLGRSNGLPLPPAATLSVGAQVCEALGYAHTAKAYDGTPMAIVHRDIKPANLMITPHGQVKVTDFGIARASTNLRQTAPGSGSGKGTLAYMAPEQLQGGEIGPTADLYALGAVLFELITGRLLFEATSLGQVISRRKQGLRPEDLEQTGESMPELIPVLERALAPELADRFADAAEMGAALRALKSFDGTAALQEWAGRLSSTEATMDHATESITAGKTIAPAGEPAQGSAPGPLKTDVMDRSELVAVADGVEPNPLKTPPPAEAMGAGVGGTVTAAGGGRGWIVAAVVGVVLLLAVGLALTRPWERGVGPVGTDPVTSSEIGEQPSAAEVPTPSPVEPATAEPATAEPVTAEPATAEPATAEPATAEPTTAEPVTAEPLTEAPVHNSLLGGSGLLNVRVVPWGTIFVDSVPQAEDGSLENMAVGLGDHHIRVVPNDGSPSTGRHTTFTEDGEHQKWSFQYVDGTWQVRQR